MGVDIGMGMEKMMGMGMRMEIGMGMAIEDSDGMGFDLGFVIIFIVRIPFLFL